MLKGGNDGRKTGVRKFCETVPLITRNARNYGSAKSDNLLHEHKILEGKVRVKLFSHGPVGVL
jgi:hypothetical protein